MKTTVPSQVRSQRVPALAREAWSGWLKIREPVSWTSALCSNLTERSGGVWDPHRASVFFTASGRGGVARPRIWLSKAATP